MNVIADTTLIEGELFTLAPSKNPQFSKNAYRLARYFDTIAMIP